jgi:hypothetical protein
MLLSAMESGAILVCLKTEISQLKQISNFNCEKVVKYKVGLCFDPNEGKKLDIFL